MVRSTLLRPLASRLPVVSSSLPSLHPVRSRAFLVSSLRPRPRTLAAAAFRPLDYSSLSIVRQFSSSPAPANEELDAKLKRYWRIAVDECKFLWAGTKELFAELGHARTIQKRLKQDQFSISWNEMKQLQRAKANIVKLGPFLVLVIVPFGEFAIPPLLMYFPNFLPSTYIKPAAKAERKMKEIATQHESMKYLHSMMQHMNFPADQAALTQSFKDLVKRVQAGESVSEEEILKLRPLFAFGINQLPHKQLVALAQMWHIPRADRKTPDKLVESVEKHYEQLCLEDQYLLKGDLKDLPEEDLREACRERGLPSHQSPELMRKRLSFWLALRSHQVPSPLVLMSPVFYPEWLKAPAQQIVDAKSVDEKKH